MTAPQTIIERRASAANQGSTMTVQIDRARAHAEEAETALSALRAKLAELDVNIAAAGDRGAYGDFAEYVREGDTALKRPTAMTLRTARAELKEVIDAGVATVRNRWSAVEDLERAQRQAMVDAMTMSDAVAFAHGILNGIDVIEVGRRLDRIETDLAELHEPRLEAGNLLGEASARYDTATVRQGAGNMLAGTSLTELRDQRDALQVEADRLRRRATGLDAQHLRAREELTDQIGAAFTHIARLAIIEAKRADEHAAAVRAFAVALTDRPRERPVPGDLKLDLPSGGEMADLFATVSAIRAVADRRIPERPSDSTYFGQARGTGVVG